MTDDEHAAQLLTGAGIDASHVPKLARFTELVLAQNRKLNLTGATSVEEFVPHILDSLTVAPYIREPYIDVGSGAGLPGIPAAIVTGIPVTLLEATIKKARFLESLAQQIELDVRVLARRAEDAGRDPELRERFASATARAVAAASTVLELTAPLLDLDGMAILQRGRMGAAERDALEDAALILGCHVGAEVPLEADRRLILVRKTTATSERFPRRAGIPQKRPLGE